jgi:hypothetical protein
LQVSLQLWPDTFFHALLTSPVGVTPVLRVEQEEKLLMMKKMSSIVRMVSAMSFQFFQFTTHLLPTTKNSIPGAVCNKFLFLTYFLKF